MILSHWLGIDRVDLYKDNPDIPDNIIVEIDSLVREKVKEGTPAVYSRIYRVLWVKNNGGTRSIDPETGDGTTC